MAKKFLRSFASIASLFLASCKGPSPELTVEDISIYAEPDANYNSALATDLVIVHSEELVKTLEKMSACTYFATTKQLLMDNPTLLDIWHWEFVPGQSVQNFSPCGGKGRAFAAFVFANYLTPGEHRLKVAPDGVVKIILGKEDLKDLSKARLQDMKLGATMSKPEDFCPTTNPEFNKWSTIGEAVSADNASDNAVKKGPITAHCPPPPRPCQGAVGKTGTPIVIKPLPPCNPPCSR